MLVSVAVIAIVVGVAVFAARKLDPGRSENSVYVLLLGFVLLGSLLVLSLIGTVLPAAAAGDPLGPAFGLPRLRATFGWVFRGLLVGPAVTGLAGFELLGFAGRVCADRLTKGQVARGPGMGSVGIGSAGTTRR